MEERTGVMATGPGATTTAIGIQNQRLLLRQEGYRTRGYYYGKREAEAEAGHHGHHGGKN